MNKIKNALSAFFRRLFSRRGLSVILLTGIAVSLISSHLEDMVKKQRYLELLEYEIKSHITFAAIDKVIK